MTSLDSLPAGSRVRLVSVGGERAFRCRLMEMGLLPGTAVRLVRRADAGGVLELEVRGSRLTVRHGEARQLLVQSPDA
jgi:Fe2+ transport system protein FeoA